MNNHHIVNENHQMFILLFYLKILIKQFKTNKLKIEIIVIFIFCGNSL